MKGKMLLVLLSTMLLLTSCGGKVTGLKREIGASSFYSQKEIDEAMDTAIGHFKKEFNGCHMTLISYSDERTVTAGDDWAEQYGDDEGIVLLSNFTVDASGGDGGFNANGNYTHWQWILTRSDKGDWVLRTWGYG